MANINKPTGTEKLREAFPKWNGNDESLNSDIANLQSQMTTNETDIENKLQAHKDSTTAHAAQNITYSGTIINAAHVKAALEALLVQINNIVANSGSANTEVVDARLGADNVARATLGVLVREIHAKQLEAAKLTTTLKQGLQAITGNIDTPLNVLNLRGRTLVNLLGRDGNFEVDGGGGVGKGWLKVGSNGSMTLETTNAKYGLKAQRITALVGDTTSTRKINKNVTLDAGKTYLVLVDVVNDGVSTSRLQVWDGASNIVSVTATTNKLLYGKITPVATQSFEVNLMNYSAVGTTGWVQFDGGRLYELSTAESIAIDSMTEEQIAPKYPYIDSVQHIFSPVIEKRGKNLSPQLLDWNVYSGVRVQKGANEADVSGTNGLDYNHPIVPGATYSAQATFAGLTGRLYYQFQDSAGVNVGPGFGVNGLGLVKCENMVSPSNAAKLRVAVLSANSGETTTVSNPQVELSAVATTFEPAQPDYLYFPGVTLAASLDGTVADTITQRDGALWKTKRWETDVVLDGSLVWGFGVDYTGFKTIIIPDTTFNNYGDNLSQLLVKYDGKILKRDDNLHTNPVADAFRTGSGTGSFWISVSDTDSGWGESYTPTANDIKRYFNGWKYSDGTTWTSVTGNGQTATAQQALDTKPTDYTPHKLSYQLATTKEEVIQPEGGISLNAPGNHINVDSGVVVREKAVADLNSGLYIINASNLTNRLNNKTEKIIAIYKNGVLDNRWVIASSSFAHGKQRVSIEQSLFDPTAEYSVTYLPLDKHLFTNAPDSFAVEYQANDKGVIRQNAQAIADLRRDVTVIQSLAATKTQKPWIAPTFQNGWINYGGSEASTGYFKDDFGQVHIKGRIKSGTIGTAAFTLPAGYRPKEPFKVPIASNGAHGEVTINVDGTIVISVATNTDVSIKIPAFRAEV